MSYGTDFDGISIQAIDGAMLALGERLSTAIYCSLEKNYLKRRDIPRRIWDFSDALDRIFGLAARSLEIMFTKNPRSRIASLCVGIVIEQSSVDVTFQNYFDMLRQRFEESCKERENIGMEFLIYEGE